MRPESMVAPAQRLAQCSPKGVWDFRSRPDLGPAAAEVTGRSRAVPPSATSSWLIKEGVGEHGPDDPRRSAVS